MKELYLANIWPQIVTKRGVQMFNMAGYEVSGNWLNGVEDYTHASNIVLPYADFGKPAKIPCTNDDMWKRVASYILFPDSMVGWNCKTNDYLLRQNDETTAILKKSSKRLSHSIFSSRLIANVYGQGNESVVPLGIDTNSIIEAAQPTQHKDIRVLWNHMWRIDKGTLEAFSIIKNLAQKYPKVEFRIGQLNTWDSRPEALGFKEKCLPILTKLQNMDNVKFYDRIKNQKDYWTWVGQSDVAFSTAFHEGFGLSMLEQEASGIACVVPNAEAYPEIHAGCLIVERDQIETSLEELITNPITRKSVARSCADNSLRYDTSVWVANLLKTINI